MEREPGPGGPIVAGYSGSGFRIGGSAFPALLMTVDEAYFWSPPPLAALDTDALRQLIEARPEFILLGTGAYLARPPLALTRALEAENIGIEPMDSRAAARAWGVLRSEGRIVAAALYPLDA